MCRMRPMLPHDSDQQEASTISYPTSLDLRGRGIYFLQKDKKLRFTLNKVISPTASQHDVFGEVSKLVQSALDGQKVCIFTNSQMGSEKTFTMIGRPESPQPKGLIPRSVEKIFQYSQSLSALGWTYKLKASILEVYNKKIKDLIVENQSTDLTIKQDANGHSYISDHLTVVDVVSIEQIFTLLQHATQSRPESPQPKGLIPRSVEKIFQYSQSLSALGWTYKLKASILEVYNKKIKDLIVENQSTDLTIKQDANGHSYISDHLTVVDVISIEQIFTLLQRATQSRSVGATQMNEQSSRGHLVFTVQIFGVNKGTGQQVERILNLIDLAGSERVAKSGAVGKQLEEAKAINLSQSHNCLGKEAGPCSL